MRTTRGQGRKAKALSSKNLEEQGPDHKRPRMYGQSPQQQQPSRTGCSPQEAKDARPKPSAATGLKHKVLTTRSQGCRAKAVSSNRLEEQGAHHRLSLRKSGQIMDAQPTDNWRDRGQKPCQPLPSMFKKQRASQGASQRASQRQPAPASASQ